ncbi:hypothetical protein EDD18DRAFT_1111476 [Armillaria luteobubalina]|uniref:Uncharacterized protein n=1 Tax=Armillaria luteobubalina TaxID=153913 RepID=A0AA39PLS0_9AGAR|nr:hypothetical protein EDD18DRAFT_1111476 [Armillaria luteobubalina]
MAPTFCGSVQNTLIKLFFTVMVGNCFMKRYLQMELEQLKVHIGIMILTYIHFHGAFLTSRWVSMQEDLGLPQHLLKVKHQYDSLSAQYGWLTCRMLLNDVPLAKIPFVDPLETPEDQFDGLSTLVEHVFMMWCEVEFLRVGQRWLCERYMELYHPRVEVCEQVLGIQVLGIHCQLIWDSVWMGNVWEPRIMDWFALVYAADKEELN